MYPEKHQRCRSQSLDGSPSMNFDNAANAMWIGGASFDSPHTVGAKASIELYHSRKNDIWDWKDLHIDGTSAINWYGFLTRRLRPWT